MPRSHRRGWALRRPGAAVYRRSTPTSRSIPRSRAGDLVEVEQAQFKHVHLDEEVATAGLERPGAARVDDKVQRFLSADCHGRGAFEPRKREPAGIDHWEGRGLHYFVTRKDVFKGKNCVIVGGGDSALDWTLGLQDTADLPITLSHRRERFRALETSVNEARRLEGEGSVRICAPAEVREIHGDGSIQAVTVEDTGTGETIRLDCEALILLLGFHSHLGSIADWGLDLHGKRQILVDPMSMDTSIPGVTAGDVAG